MGDSTKQLIQVLLSRMPFSEGMEYEPEVSKVLNSKKVSDHHAIIPTSEVEKADLQKLKEKERNILYLISARVLTATADSYIYETHKCQLTCNFHTFYFNARKTKQEGFQAIEKKLKQFLGVREPEQEAEFDLYLGRNIGPCSTSVSENFTQPPRQYTEDTLLAAMERAGNEDLTEDTEKKGLGTPATRAGIIEKLIQSGFVKREKKNLVPTDAGNVLVTVLPDEIKSPKMTAEWEMALNHIAQGTETAELAANSQVGESMVNPLKYYNNNLCGTEVLLESMVAHGINKIVFSSTAATYGEPERIPILETDRTVPTNCYGETKLSMEKMFKWTANAHDLRFVSLRYFNACGAHPNGKIGEAHNPETHLIPLILQVPNGKREYISIFGNDYETKDGTCVRDYIHVNDLAQAHILAMEFSIMRT